MILPQLKPLPHHLPADEFGTTVQLMAEAGRGNDPIMVIVTCWELAGAPDEISRARPGEVMVAQNPGGLVPAVEMHQPGSALDTVRYALSYPTVRHLIVCGHTECNTLGFLLKKSHEEKPNPFYDHLLCFRERFRTAYANRCEHEYLGLIVQESILQQLANLRSHDDIRIRLEAGDLRLHGWLRDDETAVITAFNPETGQFDK